MPRTVNVWRRKVFQPAAQHIFKFALENFSSEFFFVTTSKEKNKIKAINELTVRGTQALVSFAPLAFKLFYAARQNAVLRRSPFPSQQ